MVTARDIPKAHKVFSLGRVNITANAKKIAQLCQREVRRTMVKSQRICKDAPRRCKKMMNEVSISASYRVENLQLR
jgi:hypothetical protein